MASNNAKSSSDSGRQISILPSLGEDDLFQDPVQDAQVSHQEPANRRRKSALTRTGKDRSDPQYAVVGEKQFKNPKLFPPPNTPGLDRPRTITFPVSDDNIERNITVLGNNVTSGYTTHTLVMMAFINLLWREAGSPQSGEVKGTYAGVAKSLKLDPNNPSKARKHVASELERLRRCVLIFSRYQMSDQTKHNQEITYFSDFEYIENTQNPSLNEFRAVIDQHVLVNMLTKQIASLPLDALVSLKQENSKPVFLKVDSILAVADRCELLDTSIFELIEQPDTVWFSKPSIRLKVLEAIKMDIFGKKLSCGWTVCVSHEKASGEGSKLVFTRGENIKTERRDVHRKTLPVLNDDPISVQQLVEDMISTVGHAADNERLYNLFARSYPEDMMFQALSEFKADKPSELKSPGAFFTSIVSRLAMESGHAWIRD